MIILFIVAGCVYILRAAVLRAGIAAARREAKGREPAELPFITVVVAARNEGGNIARCLESLAAQSYPRDRYEVLAIDDGSTDDTEAIMRAAADAHAVVRALRVTREESHLRGKARAVAQAFDAARGEILVTTDADCVVPPTWLATHALHFAEGTGAVAGFTLQESAGVFSGVQSLDWVALQSMACAGLGLGAPLGCIGNNLAFHRDAYASVGGYRGIPFSVTEDFALFDEVYRTRKWRPRYMMDAGALVWSLPCPNVKTLWRQKVRWALGGKSMGMRGYVIALVTGLFDLSIIVALVTGSWWWCLALIAARWLSDAAIMLPTLRTLRAMHLLKYYPAYEAYAFLYELCFPIALMQTSVEWKGRTFHGE